MAETGMRQRTYSGRNLYCYENSNTVRNRIGGRAGWLFLDA
jgi:uncharacterized protein YraI